MQALERPARYKHASLLGPFVGYEEKGSATFFSLSKHEKQLILLLRQRRRKKLTKWSPGDQRLRLTIFFPTSTTTTKTTSRQTIASSSATQKSSFSKLFRFRRELEANFSVPGSILILAMTFQTLSLLRQAR